MTKNKYQIITKFKISMTETWKQTVKSYFLDFWYWNLGFDFSGSSRLGIIKKASVSSAVRSRKLQSVESKAKVLHFPIDMNR